MKIPDINDSARYIVEAIRLDGESTREAIERQTRATRGLERTLGAKIDSLGEKIDGQTEVLKELVRLNTGVLKLLERADIKIAD